MKLKWHPISTGPKNATTVQLKLRDGRIVNGHWASNLSEEEQPPFEGWFENGERYNKWVEPTHWRAIR